MKDEKNKTSYYYYYDGKKQYFELDTKYAFVSIQNINSEKVFKSENVKYQPFRTDIPEGKQKEASQKRFWTYFNIDDQLSNDEYLNKLKEIKDKGKDIIVAPYFKNKHQDKIGLSNFFYVKLKSEHDTHLLKQEADKENAIIIYRSNIDLWYVLSITENSKFNAMEVANRFYESGLFQYAEPDLLIDDAINCANDPFFPQQWGLKNTGQMGGLSGIDINSCDAWQLSTGNNIVVTVLDNGIELNHPDLSANIYALSYDSESRTSPQKVLGDHGTACAGIIGALRNNIINGNYEGIAGVAPNCKIMSVSNSLLGVPLSREARGAGIDWAWKNGADIISNSWSSLTYHQIVTDAINDAVNLGRLRYGVRLGCIVIFASGNDSHSSISWPANLQNVISVGAINRNGLRANFSNYGNGLNVVAPGVDIYTTDRQGSAGYSTGNYVSNFTGTSAACPFVAGIAALILSKYPNLKYSQVRQAIEYTCQKINESSPSNPNGYVYSPSTNPPDSTWNDQVGHGLVDASEAINIVSIARTINLGFHFNGGPQGVSAYCSGSGAGFTLTRGSSQNYQATNYNGHTIDQAISVDNNYRIFLEEEPRGDYVLTGEGTSYLSITYYLPMSGNTVNSLILKFYLDPK